MKNEILKIYNEISAVISTIVTILTSTFGSQWMLFAGYFLLNVVDYITGTIKAKKLKQENSNKGMNGIIKNLCYWILIAVTFVISYIIAEILKNVNLNININFIMFFGWFTLACLAINEARSIIENLVEMGIEVPKFLIKGLEKAQNNVMEEIEEEIEEKEENPIENN